jgi:hypothetical protein
MRKFDYSLQVDYCNEHPNMYCTSISLHTPQQGSEFSMNYCLGESLLLFLH